MIVVGIGNVKRILQLDTKVYRDSGFPVDHAMGIAEQVLIDHNKTPVDASPQLALNALASWVSKNRGHPVAQAMLRCRKQDFDEFREAWEERFK